MPLSADKMPAETIPAEKGPLRETAFAKINLALHIRRRLDDGYHALETLFAFVDHGDVITAQPAETLSLSITGPFAAGLNESDNLVLDAARALQERAAITAGAQLTLDKKLPVASGIGGGSADAATTLRLLNRMWDVNLPAGNLAKLAESLGADIPACVYSQTMRGEGTGAELIPYDMPELRDLSILMVNPMVAVSTEEIFKGWDGVDDGPLTASNLSELAGDSVNGLQAAAIKRCPEIEPLLSRLEQSAPLLARMSGSGATCFGIYAEDSICEGARRQITKAFPDYWTQKGRLL